MSGWNWRRWDRPAVRKVWRRRRSTNFPIRGRIAGGLVYESPIAAELKTGALHQATGTEVTIRIDEGCSRDFVAQSFVNSVEFATKYGPLDTLGFVQRLYNNVLGRDGEVAGVFGWVDGLNHGLTRAQVLEGFSESGENVAKTAALTANWIHYHEWWLA